MRTEAQKRARKAYESKQHYINVRTTYHTANLIKAEAARHGQSLTAYILQAAKERMARDKQARKAAEQEPPDDEQK